jgi:hypothetical protein
VNFHKPKSGYRHRLDRGRLPWSEVAARPAFVEMLIAGLEVCIHGNLDISCQLDEKCAIRGSAQTRCLGRIVGDSYKEIGALTR